MNAEQIFLEHIAYKIRLSSIEATTCAGSGHPTSALSAADLVTALFFYGMHFDPQNPHNPNNDRFILSKGHAAPALYAVWEELGIISHHELLQLRTINSPLEGHPTPLFSRCEAATGSLGQGLSIGAGIALSAKIDNYTFKTFVLLGDSELAEGSVWEALEISAYYKLNNLIAILDCNRLGQSTETMSGYHLEQYQAKFKAFGWHTIIVNGHDMADIMKALNGISHNTEKTPIMIIAKTVKGYGIPSVENKEGFHGKVFKKEELPHIFDELKKRFPLAQQKADFAWHVRMPAAIEADKGAPLATSQHELPGVGIMVAPRKAYGQALAQIGSDPCIVSLDAEVKNSTYAELFEQKHPRRFIQCFVAEQNMVGMGVGLAARGKIPFISTFGAFFTRAFDQIRMAAIGKSPLRLVGSHVGVSIGQDGPSQMALEDIAIMRTLPGSIILYPSDAISTYALVDLMHHYSHGISYLRITRAETPVLYNATEAFHIGGCKILKKSNSDQACIVTAGITLFEALKASDMLGKEGIFVSIIDLYSIKPFDQETVERIAQKSNNILITVEDHYAQGGIGEMISAALCNTTINIHCLAVTKLPRSGAPEALLAYESIDAHAIVRTIKSALGLRKMS